MNRNIQISLLLTALLITLGGCVSKKKKGEVSKVGKFYHNMTSKYNGYFNANEIMEEAYATLEASHEDNYNEILPVYPYIESTGAKTVSPELDRAIEKVTKVAIVHEPGDYVDDCYVMMGQAQFLKQDYELAEETFRYFQEEFNPLNPNGKGFKKKSKKQLKKERNAEKKAEKKKREEEKKAKAKAKEEDRKAKEKAKEEEKKAREKERKAKEEARKKDREAQKKAREKARKDKKKKRKKGKRKSRADREKEKKAKEAQRVQDSIAQAKKLVKEIKTTEPVTNTKVDEATGKEEPNDEVEEEPVKEDKKEEAVDKTAYSEGLLWLAKTYIERQNYSSAEQLLTTLDRKAVQDKVRRDIAPALAHLYIRQKEYDRALPYLDQAIETADSKKDKARYAYIAGQIYQKLGRQNEASQAFARVNKFKPTFDMRFNALLASLKNDAATGQRSVESVEGEIAGMVKERKYAEYKDQLYFTLGNIDLDQNQNEAAIKDYKQSLAFNTEHTSLKTETYYQMAQIYFEGEQYVPAKLYYDSTLTTLDKTDSRYTAVKGYSENLSDIARNLEIIRKQDSLLRLANMSDEELRKYAEEEAKKQAELAAQKAAENPDTENGQPRIKSGREMFGTSDKWPYDLSKVERGKKEFETVWGDIPLQDNWRRSSELNAFYEGNDVAESGAQEGQKEEVSEDAINKIIKSIPKSKKDISNAHSSIMDAMYELGVLYRSKLDNYDKSTATLEELLDRYPTYEKKLDVYYNLYLNALEVDDKTRAKKYLDKIAKEFPESKIAKTLTDPAYASKQVSDKDRVNFFYEQTYKEFDMGRYAEVISRVDVADQKFTFEHDLKPKFALLKAMSLGKVNGKPAYIAALTDVVTRYPKSSESTRAKEILRFLKGDDEAFDVLDVKAIDDIFKIEDDRRHYCIIVTRDVPKEVLAQAKIAISRYNKEYHSHKRLKISENFLDKDSNKRIILIRQFENKDAAMKYFKQVTNSKEEFFGGQDMAEAEFLVTTQTNYRKIIQEKSTNKYRVFFDQNYLDVNK